MDVRASARYVRVAPNKARQIVGHIRGLDVEQARNVLLLEPKGAGRYVRKVLESAIANAENNHDLDPDDLVVTSAVVDEGPTLKRFQPRAMGRAYRIRKRTSHITIILGTSRSLVPRNTRRTGSAGRKTEE
jgi:large subunit ribosomal protein L22